MDNSADPFMSKAISAVHKYINANLEKTDETPIYQVYVVWFAKTLQNWKVLLSSTLPDQMYYEITYDGDKGCMYLDAYKKFRNLSIPD